MTPQSEPVKCNAMKKNKFFYLKDYETTGFGLSDLKEKALWTLIWWGIRANFGIGTYSKEPAYGRYFTVGFFPDYLLYDLFLAGYTQNTDGWILGQPVNIYSKS